MRHIDLFLSKQNRSLTSVNLGDKRPIAPMSVGSGGDWSPHGGSKIICLKSVL